MIGLLHNFSFYNHAINKFEFQIISRTNRLKEFFIENVNTRKLL